jgi:ribosomal protein S27E
MNETLTIPIQNEVKHPRSSAFSHAQVYHVRCGQCGAATVFDLATDAVRMICPTCSVRLTLPATVDALCTACHTLVTYPHTLAGHSTSCSSCGRTVLLEPVVGSAEGRRHHHHHHHHHRRHHRRRAYHDRTLAFSEGAERSLILIAAAIATLIFVVAVSMHQIL